MKRINGFAILLALCVSGCAHQPQGGSSAAFENPTLASSSGVAVSAVPAPATPAISHERIVQTLRARLEADRGVDSHNVHLQLQGTELTLSGLVTTLLAKERALQLARATPGVQTINDQLVVSPVESTDPQILNQVVRALRASPPIAQYDINTAIQRGIVTLSGKVDSVAERDLAELLTKGVRGVRGVENELQVGYNPHRPDTDIQNDIVARVKWDPYLQGASVTVGVQNGNVQLNGYIPTETEKERLTRDAWVEGVQSVDASRLRIVPNVERALEHDAER